MKKISMVLFIIILGLFMLGCNRATPRILEVVDLGCCATDIVVREAALLGINSVTYTSDNFIMTLNSDRKFFTTTDVINIWATLEYIGDNNTIRIHHGCPLMIFSITDGDGFCIGGLRFTVAVSSVLQRGRVYHFEYQKNGGWDANASDATFWENFFSEEDLLLPAGEYTITLHGGFSAPGNASGLVNELMITVKPYYWL